MSIALQDRGYVVKTEARNLYDNAANEHQKYLILKNPNYSVEK
jgi:hypothetical protein